MEEIIEFIIRLVIGNCRQITKLNNNQKLHLKITDNTVYLHSTSGKFFFYWIKL